MLLKETCKMLSTKSNDEKAFLFVFYYQYNLKYKNKFANKLFILLTEMN